MFGICLTNSPALRLNLDTMTGGFVWAIWGWLRELNNVDGRVVEVGEGRWYPSGAMWGSCGGPLVWKNREGPGDEESSDSEWGMASEIFGVSRPDARTSSESRPRPDIRIFTDPEGPLGLTIGAGRSTFGHGTDDRSVGRC